MNWKKILKESEARDTKDWYDTFQPQDIDDSLDELAIRDQYYFDILNEITSPKSIKSIKELVTKEEEIKNKFKVKLKEKEHEWLLRRSKSNTLLGAIDRIIKDVFTLEGKPFFPVEKNGVLEDEGHIYDNWEDWLDDFEGQLSTYFVWWNSKGWDESW